MSKFQIPITMTFWNLVLEDLVFILKKFYL
ncbi:hypothetical protein KCTC32420_01162 [Aequorivita nionensis]